MWPLLLLFSFMAQAGTFSKHHCSKEIEKMSSDWGARGPWELHTVNGLERGFLASTTAQFGEWVLIRNLKDGAVLSKAESSGRTEVKLVLPDCKKEVKVYPHAKIGEDTVSDDTIKKFIENNPKGVIYNWSPRMVLSMQGIKEIQAASKSLKLPLLILMDKDVSEQERISLAGKLDSEVMRRVDSFDFKMRSVGLHYPALMVFKNKMIIPKVKYGFEKAEHYKLDLADMLK